MSKEEAYTTCSKENTASRKMIEDVGGVLQDEIIEPVDQRSTLVIWIGIKFRDSFVSFFENRRRIWAWVFRTIRECI